MSDFAWILCSKDEKTEWWQKGWLGNIIQKLYLSLFAKPQMYKLYSSEEKKAEGYLIRIPWNKRELNTLGKSSISGMAHKITKLAAGSNISRLYPEPCLMVLDSFRNEITGSGTKCLNCGYDMFAALTENMLLHIADKKGKIIEKLEIAIMTGDDLEVLKTLMLKLAGSLGMVTITGDHSAELDNWLESICDDTGLCVRTTRNINSAIEDCDVVISFEESFSGSKYLHKPVIWFGKKNGDISRCYEFHPYRIEIDFPAILYNHYMQELVSCFGSLGVAEAFIDSEIDAVSGNSFPEIERVNLLKRLLYEKMEEIRYIRKALE